MAKSVIEEWVKAYSDELYSWALYKTSDKETSEDLVQETFLSALKHLEGFEGKASPKTWLFSILKNKIIDHYRLNAKKIVHNESEYEKRQEATFLSFFFEHDGHWKSGTQPKQWAEEAAPLLDDEHFTAMLQQCLGKLPKVWHSALQLKYLEEKEGKEICQELDITPSNFWQVLHRAKLQMRNCLEINWFIR